MGKESKCHLMAFSSFLKFPACQLDSPVVQLWTLSSDGKLIERTIFDQSLVPAFSYYSVGEGQSASAELTGRFGSQQQERMIYIGKLFHLLRGHLRNEFSWVHEWRRYEIGRPAGWLVVNVGHSVCLWAVSCQRSSCSSF